MELRQSYHVMVVLMLSFPAQEDVPLCGDSDSAVWKHQKKHNVNSAPGQIFPLQHENAEK